MNKEQAKKLFSKYINYNCTPEEREQLEAFFNSYQESGEDWLGDVFGNKEVFKKESWVRIHSQINNEKSQYSFSPYLKYVAAASVLLIVALTIFLNKDASIQIQEPVISNKNIEPGTDKATLTLEDGTKVALEKGDSFQTQNANSNGEQIIYQQNKKEPKKIAYNYLTIPRGGQFHVVLSDGTEVWLNSESQLKYPVVFIKGEPREVELVYGEAYFDVSPSLKHNGTKFQVLNKAQNVEVLGTEFNIKAYKDETNIYTTLVEGSVKVFALNKVKTLTPNKQLNLNLFNNSMESSLVDVYSEISWREGVFSFKDKPLKDIMKVISRWYDVEVVFNDKTIEEKTFRGSLNKKVSIEEILSIMTGATTISYEINDKIILLK